MEYSVNPAVFSSVFTVPCDVADKHLKLASDTQLRVLLFVMRNISNGTDPQIIAKELGAPQSEVEDALLYWSQCNILNGAEPPKAEKEAKVATIETAMPSREDVIKRGMEDEKVMLLLREAQLKFGRNLKNNESSLLIFLYDDCGMDISVILMLLQYAASENRCNISFIKSTATKWINAGIENVIQAEKEIAKEAKQKIAWKIVERAFGIESRRPSEKELLLSSLWVDQWQISEEVLRYAYDACIDSKTKLSMPYIAKILENWHSKGYTTIAQIKEHDAKHEAKKEKPKKYSYAGYDLDLFEKMLNSDDDE